MDDKRLLGRTNDRPDGNGHRRRRLVADTTARAQTALMAVFHPFAKLFRTTAATEMPVNVGMGRPAEHVIRQAVRTALTLADNFLKLLGNARAESPQLAEYKAGIVTGADEWAKNYQFGVMSAATILEGDATFTDLSASSWDRWGWFDTNMEPGLSPVYDRIRATLDDARARAPARGGEARAPGARLRGSRRRQESLDTQGRGSGSCCRAPEYQGSAGGRTSVCVGRDNTHLFTKRREALRQVRPGEVGQARSEH